MSNPILDAALELAAAGYSVIPIRADGSKAPALTTWKRHTTERAQERAVRTWFADLDGREQYDLGVVQGAISGGAELTELEGRAAAELPGLRELAHDTGLGDLWDRFTTGWVEMSPSGGFHFHYRITDAPVPGNLKLARAQDRLVLAETRGEGGQVVVAPSRHHATGRPWTRLLGGPATAPTVTLEERDAFHAILRTLDVVPELLPPAQHPGTPAPRQPGDGITPGDDYEARTDWADILKPHGWVHVFTRGRTRMWRRPGKNTSISATTGHADDRDRLYVFTSSTDFEQEVPYTKLGAYAVLEHGGDYSAAARALYAAGFGARAEQLRPVTPDDPADPFAGGTVTGPAPSGTRPTEAGTPPPERHLQVVPPLTYSDTDDGNALRLVDAHEGLIRYCPQRGSWLTWDGHRWRWDEANSVRELSRAIARDLEHGRHRTVSLSRRGIEAMTALAQSDSRAVTHLAQLDARPYELNTPAGVINLRTGELEAPKPDGLHTRSTAVAPDFDTTPHRWLRFLADTFAGDPDLTVYVQRLLGVSLVGQVLEQVLPFAHGPGANGKTTLAGVVQRLVGIGNDGYSISAPAEMLLATHQQGHPTEIARLSGARIVVTSELEDGQNFAEAKIKMLTGRDTISGRFMRQDWFSFTPTHTLWLLANHQPAVRAGGPAFWRRLRLLPFEHTVPTAQRIADLEDRLVDDEGPAILAWLIRGAADYFAHGLAEPASVLAATDAYATDQDTVGRFVTELCTTGDPNAQHLQVKVSTLRQAYETWCRTEGEQPVTAKALTTALHSRFGVIPGRDKSARFYSGIRLDDPSPEDAEPVTEQPAWQQERGW